MPGPAPDSETREPKAWMILHKPDTTWGDVPGTQYHYPSSIPNGKRIAFGDWLAATLPASANPSGLRAFVGLGRVASITPNDDDSERVATYGTYYAIEPALPIDAVGASMPKAIQQSMTPLDQAVVERLLELIAGGAGTEVVSTATEASDLGVIKPPSPVTPPTFEWLLEQTLWPKGEVELLLDTLQNSSPQVVLAGPPGTSKTWVAKAVAAYLTKGRSDGVRLVQFHPSYTYEQFMEGLRPTVRAGGIQFERVDGVVLDLVRSLRRGEPKVLVIDEMNRANLPRVLGELMYLFEYRDEEIALQYSPRFRLPKELLFLGTMNTADRSIRSLDIALRRRFDVFECPPDPEILARFYDGPGNQNDIPDLIAGFTKLNEALEKELDRHHTIGHAFFMAKTMTPQRLGRVWDHKIGPLIEEYFFDRPDLAAGFVPASYWSSLAPHED